MVEMRPGDLLRTIVGNEIVLILGVTQTGLHSYAKIDYAVFDYRGSKKWARTTMSRYLMPSMIWITHTKDIK